MAWAVHIVDGSNPAEIRAVRELWEAYWQSLGFARDFQHFDHELDALPGKYAPPQGRLFLVRIDGHPAATAALRPLSAETCEAKRLYVTPAYRGRGIAAALMARLIEEARTAGYRRICGDTFATMDTALAMYRRMGFVEVGPYSPDPTPGALYLQLDI
ncbi:MAG: GNAT family N-acetyltransferase [Bryobacteraceae bacterium]